MNIISQINYDKNDSESEEEVYESEGTHSESRSDSSERRSSDDSNEEEGISWRCYTRQHKLDIHLPKFSLKPGINKKICELTLPIQFFQLYFHDSLLQEIYCFLLVLNFW